MKRPTAPLSLIPTLEPGDPLAVLATHYATLTVRLAALEVELDRLHGHVGKAEAEAFEEAEHYPARTEFTRVEEELRDAMNARGLQLAIVAGHLVVNTGSDLYPRLPDCPNCIWTYNLAGLPAVAPDDDEPWLFCSSDLVESEEAAPGEVRLTFAVRGPRAFAVREWLNTHATAVNDI